jgi:hypothetical protein
MPAPGMGRHCGVYGSFFFLRSLMKLTHIFMSKITAIAKTHQKPVANPIIKKLSIVSQTPEQLPSCISYVLSSVPMQAKCLHEVV